MFFQVAPMDSHQGNWRLHLLFHDVIAEGVSRLEMSCGYPNPCEQRRGMYLVAFLSNEFCCWSCFNNIKAMALFNTIDGHATSFDSIMPLALLADLSVMFFWIDWALNDIPASVLNGMTPYGLEQWEGQSSIYYFDLLWGWPKAELFRFWHTCRGDRWLMDREGNEGDSAGAICRKYFHARVEQWFHSKAWLEIPAG